MKSKNQKRSARKGSALREVEIVGSAFKMARQSSGPESEGSVTKQDALTEQYESEARIIRSILQSEHATQNVKDVFRFFLADMMLSTEIVTMDDALLDLPHLDPQLLLAIYPEMRRRDGGGRGVVALMQSVLNGLTGTDNDAEEKAISEILRAEQSRPGKHQESEAAR